MYNDIQLLNVSDVSKILNCGVSTIWRWVSDGKFPAPTKIGGCTRWKASDVLNFIDKPNQETSKNTQPKAPSKKRRLRRTKLSTK
ncbi:MULTISPECIES: helix-turn-helix transcriptional regulator [Pacificibacter]|uniref:helix-turn-helix transcriptional regulator n=1 Tax=Pacificibacter TaxID=1042323 RepID=UPI001C0A33BB|nr:MULTISPECIES: helix-turn-helix domain-containing protein [Pacificibacter]MBU2937527.1 helix-turn-helix domain-containing protein [Pacificibacter marinus]MDO6615707.1 helix-turn-helix domain-containing protein [Pacificibacter sp. 1_MG-2023]